MKKIIMLFVAFLLTAALFAQVSGSVGSTTAYDADAESITETIETSIAVGPVTIGNTFILSDSLAELAAGEEDPEMNFDWKGAIDYKLNEALSFGATLTYGVDSDEDMPLTLKAAYKPVDFLSLTVSYANANLNPPEGEDAGIGTFTLAAKISF